MERREFQPKPDKPNEQSVNPIVFAVTILLQIEQIMKDFERRQEIIDNMNA